MSESDCLTSYRLASIVRIDLSGPATPSWPYLGGAKSVTEVSEEYFEQYSTSEELAKQRLEAWGKPGSTQKGFTVLTLVTGQRIIWEVAMASTEMVALDASAVAKRLFSAGAVHGRRADGAVMLINVAHVARLAFYPGPPQTGGRVVAVKRI